MMERLRDGVNSIVVKSILSLVIFSFVFAGVSSYFLVTGEKPAVEVGDQKISRNQFEHAYQNERVHMETQVGNRFSTLLSDANYLAQFRRNVLDRMVNQTLLNQQADSLGLRVSEEQIKNSIRTMTAFQTKGVFSNDLYLAGIRRNGFTPDQFAEYMRKYLVREQLVNALQNSEFTLTGELEAMHKLEGQTRSVRTLFLSLADFSQKAEVTNKQKQEYYQQNFSQFIRPEQFKISYIELSVDSMGDILNVTENEARSYYDENFASYGGGTIQQVKVSHIMIKGHGDASKEKAEAILTELRAGVDFSKLAEIHSDDTLSAGLGGQLDWFESGVMDTTFEEAAFALKNKGSLSSIVKSSSGYHIIKLDDTKVSNSESFESVHDQIVRFLKQQQATENFSSLSKILAEKSFEMLNDLENVANAVNGRVQHTDFVSLSELNGTLANPSVVQALQLPEVREEGLNSNIIDISPEHVVVVRVGDVRPEVILPFEEVEDLVTIQLRHQKGLQAVQTLASLLVEELNTGNHTRFNDLGYQFSKPSVLSRISTDRELVALAFTIPIPEVDTSKFDMVNLLNGDVLLVALDSVTDPDKMDISLDSEMAKRVVSTMVNTELTATLDQLRASTNVNYSLQTME
ncbi:SurA N-terminal domain-containing protein [Candidatus Enterovibrio escicola]|nr:SurA N-terminal domain-containing protein [Candidatus Enterovibrio escacola]